MSVLLLLLGLRLLSVSLLAAVLNMQSLLMSLLCMMMLT
jgi:hypothetical protein